MCRFYLVSIPLLFWLVTELIEITNRPNGLPPQFPQLCSIYVQINNRESLGFGKSQGKVLLNWNWPLQPTTTEKKKGEVNIIHFNFVLYWPDTCTIILDYLASLKQNKISYGAVTFQTGYGICRVIRNCKIWLTKSLFLTKKIGAYILTYKTFIISCTWPRNILQQILRQRKY